MLGSAAGEGVEHGPGRVEADIGAGRQVGADLARARADLDDRAVAGQGADGARDLRRGPIPDAGPLVEVAGLLVEPGAGRHGRRGH